LNDIQSLTKHDYAIYIDTQSKSVQTTSIQVFLDQSDPGGIGRCLKIKIAMDPQCSIQAMTKEYWLMKSICPILDRPTEVSDTPFSHKTWSVVRCHETGLVFLSNPPDYSLLESTFAWEKTFTAERERRRLEEPIFSRLSAIFKKARMTIFRKRNKIASLFMAATKKWNRSEPLQLLDIGCGQGKLMVDIYNQSAKRGQKIIPCGIEVSKHLASLSAERVSEFGGRVISANAIEGASSLDPDSIHVVVMHSFLEHECRPLILLKRLHHILNSKGVIIIKVPNFACWNRVLRGRKWCGFRYPDHVSYFTPTTLRKLAKEAGFTVSRQNYLDRSPLSDNMYAILAKTA
jgi:2-polyprenyl-3-methyl-5-hydroxy-6-metoxy-1,4-benzoquinol methylase